MFLLFDLLDVLIRAIVIPSILVFCITSFVKDKELKKIIRLVIKPLKLRNKKTIKATERQIPVNFNSFN